MKKIIFLDREKCTGCRQCELVCSIQHTGSSNPSRARINVVKWEEEGFYLPMVCQQCLEPACKAVCPKDAISRDNELNRTVIDYNLCIACRMCVNACPFGTISLDTKEDKIIKCDLCDGDPMCVKFCEAGALQYVSEDTASLYKKRSAGAKLFELMRKYS